MRIRLLGAAWPAVLAGALVLQPAWADIYTWVDASGTVNISNLSPPEGARVTNVTHEVPQKTATRDDAAREGVRQAELQALADRVRQLENEVDGAQRPVPPPQVVYVTIPAPAPVQYQAEPAPPPVAGECDPSWASCWGWWGSGIYPASVFVVRAPIVHRFPPGHPGHGLSPGSPGHGFLPGHRVPSQGPAVGSLGFRGR
jgi:hypothetical protein